VSSATNQIPACCNVYNREFKTQSTPIIATPQVISKFESDILFSNSCFWWW